MALPPIDLSPFRTLVDFLAGAYFALVSHMGEARATTGGSGINGRVSFVEPGISGEFGLFFGVPWELPEGAAPTEAYGYQVFAGNSLVSPWGSLMFVNIGKVIAAYPDESRTHIAFDYIFKARESNPGFLRCEVYRGPPLADVVAHVNSDAIYPEIGDSYETMRTAFQYRRHGLIGRLAEHEEAITAMPAESRMRVRIPVVGDSHTPVFELI